MLRPLQPGIEPLGQFDLEDDDRALVRGGEVGVFQTLNVATDLYAADVFADPGPQVHITLDRVAAHSRLYGLVDEGTSVQGDGSASYGTMFGTVIGATTGKGTGYGAQATSGVVVIGPSTTTGSGKVTLWTKPGLYGTTTDAWTVAAEATGGSLNAVIYGDAADGTNDGKLTTNAGGNGVGVALLVGAVDDFSLVSTTNTMAGETAVSQYAAIYLAGVQIA
jgi:hypothetical protein